MNLFGERVVIEIKVDSYNLPPDCSRRFTVVKYFGDHPDWLLKSDIIPVAPIPNVAGVNGHQVSHSDVVPVPASTHVSAFDGQQMECDPIPVGAVRSGVDVVGPSMERNVMPVSRIGNVVDQNIAPDINHVVSQTNSMVVVAEHFERQCTPLVPPAIVADVIGQHNLQNGMLLFN